MHSPHWHAQVEINFITKGCLEYKMHNHVFTAKKGGTCLFWGGLPHQLVGLSDDAEYVVIHLPLVHFFRFRLPEHVREQLMHGATILTSTPDPGDFENFQRWHDYIRSNDQMRIDHAIDELILRIERTNFQPYQLISGVNATEPSTVDPQALRNIGRICSFIAENFRDDISSAEIASYAEIHPKYAMSVFKKSTGMTLNEYVNLMRLSYAQALLLSDDKNVLSVAMESGFGSVSAFNNSFKKMAGMSPSTFRRDARTRLVMENMPATSNQSKH